MALPENMRAVALKGHGGPEVLAVERQPLPTPGPGQVLIQVAAAGVNRPDIAQREGRYPVPADASPIPGLEVAGEVVALGDGVTDLSLGDAVCALVHGGGYAEFAVADCGTTMRVPAGLDLVTAATLPEVALTVEINMIQRAGLSAGESVLIHGGSSGIGTHAIQRARTAGASEIFVTVGSAAKADWCLSQGATQAINYREEDFAARVAEVTEGRGVDVILDMVGGSYVSRNLASLAADGRCAVISLQAGREVTADLEPLLRRRLTMTGSTLRPLPPARKAQLAADVVRDVWPLIEGGAIKPAVTQRFDLDAVQDAHRAMEGPDHRGKIVLTI